ncbi:hypothetical protein GS636_20715 [Ruegeria sp. HKCCD4884]|uniref:sulfotransferase n=1 Tax=Ruegeria sp. HKCCD4884 TaxID=2683022 RepID=UPI001493195B|nr:sulfotransferase [Ruegeria sp. HKCCD4884]NOD95227.1 hypothetical protein [Ruegeria sp. HKCCD4884]
MIIAFVVSLLAVAGFGLGLWILRIAAVTKCIADDAMQGISAMLDSELDDDAKEALVRKSGWSLMVGAWRVFWRFGAALAAAAFPIVVIDVIGIADSGEVVTMMLHPVYIVGVSLAAILIVRLLFRNRGGQHKETTAPGTYGVADRFAHMLAFSGSGFHKASARVDDYVFNKRADDFKVDPPIFITSLARGGTTSLLNALSQVDGLATHLYRDMPFIAAPYMWNGLGNLMNREVTQVERAHGDGLTIGLDSPEAFDEIFWHLFWPDKYRRGRIDIWHETDFRENAQVFFKSHFRKICHLRAGEAAADTGVSLRYLSKNNANIARLRLLPDFFPGCKIVVPLRRPGAHAWSLLRQHRNFMKRQAEDEFVLRYMRDIGHLEFGLLYQPMAFPGLAIDCYDLDDPNYWLAYWIAAFRDVTEQSEKCHFVTQDDLRARPNAVLPALSERLDINTGTMDFRQFFRAEPDADIDEGLCGNALMQAKDIYNGLAARAVR